MKYSKSLKMITWKKSKTRLSPDLAQLALDQDPNQFRNQGQGQRLHQSQDQGPNQPRLHLCPDRNPDRDQSLGQSLVNPDPEGALGHLLDPPDLSQAGPGPDPDPDLGLGLGPRRTRGIVKMIAGIAGILTVGVEGIVVWTMIGEAETMVADPDMILSDTEMEVESVGDMEI